jgi:hypothetical protein
VTTLVLLSDASALVPLGGAWTVAFEARDANGYLKTLVTPTVAVTKPDGSTTAPTPVAMSWRSGWYVLVTPDASGRWLAHVSTPEDAVDAAVYANGPTTEAGMPVVADVADYLGQNAGSWSTDQMQRALNAERSAQRARCGERAAYPDDLREALLRRVQRNLAMTRLPLAVQTGDADGGSTVIPGRDPEVRRLEGPYRRAVMG